METLADEGREKRGESASQSASPIVNGTTGDLVGGILDGLDLSRTQMMIVGAASAGYLFDAFDTYIVSFAMPAIATEWKLTPVFNGMLASAGMWGMFFGALVWGPIADRFGRKAGFAGTVLGFSLLSGGTAFASTTSQFIVFRFLAGLFLGGMLPVVSVMVAEQAAAGRRGRLVALPPVFWPAGLFLAALASFVFVPHFGWHSLFLAGLLPALLGMFVIVKLPESPRWLAARGEKDHAAKALAALGADARRPIDVDETKSKPERIAQGSLWSTPYLKRLAMTTSVLFFGFFGYYGFVLWLPSILALHFGMSLARAFGYTVLVGLFAILGKITAFLTIDRFGRKQLFYMGFGMAAVVSLLFGLLTQPLHLLAGACALSFFLEEAAAGCVVLPTELFPSQVRATANSWSSAAGKLAAALSPLVFGFFMARQLYYGIFVTMAVFFGIACAIIFAFGIEAKGKALQDLGAQ
jgi:MFS transporter, putative metabolite:H+ symporter